MNNQEFIEDLAAILEAEPEELTSRFSFYQG